MQYFITIIVARLCILKKYIHKPTTVRTDWHNYRNFHDLAFKEIIAFIEEEVIQQKKTSVLRFIIEMYNNILEKLYTETYDSFDTATTDHRVLEKLQEHFKDKIQVIVMHNTKIISPRDRTVITEETFTDLQDYAHLQRAAFILRKKLLNIPKKPLPNDVNCSDLIAEECDIPMELLHFVQSLICG